MLKFTKILRDSAVAMPYYVTFTHFEGDVLSKIIDHEYNFSPILM